MCPEHFDLIWLDSSWLSRLVNVKYIKITNLNVSRDPLDPLEKMKKQGIRFWHE